MGKVRIIFNRVGGNGDEKKNNDVTTTSINIEKVDEVDNDNTITPIEVKLDNVIDDNDSTSKENLKKLFSIILNLRAEDIQTGWNTNLRTGETSDGPKINLHAYGNPIGISVVYIKGEGNRKELGTVHYSTVNQMVEEFENMCSKEIKEKIILNKMSSEEFKNSMLDMEIRRNEFVKSKKNATSNMVERSEKILSLIQEYLK